jgi:hypothetical protein
MPQSSQSMTEVRGHAMHGLERTSKQNRSHGAPLVIRAKGRLKTQSLMLLRMYSLSFLGSRVVRGARKVWGKGATKATQTPRTHNDYLRPSTPD